MQHNLFSTKHNSKQRKTRDRAAAKRIRTVTRHPYLSAVALCLAVVLCAGVVLVGLVNQRVLTLARGKIYDSAQTPPQADVILVLGAGVRADGSPSDMLYDRIMQGVTLFHAGCAPVIIMSGDSQAPESYDEVGVMKQYAIQEGVPAAAILTDPQGLSTAESVRNLCQRNRYQSVIIVSQKYHLYRALFIAETCDLEAYASSADLRSYRLQWYRDMREIAARCKDFLLSPLYALQ